MKLAAGNPNLMRVNRTATLGAFAKPEKTTYRYGQSGGYVPIVRTPDMAEPRTFNHMKDGQLYKPDNSPPARAAVPDRIFINSIGVVWFCEFKRQGAKPTAAQDREHHRLRGHKVSVFVIDNVDDGKAMVDWMVRSC